MKDGIFKRGRSWWAQYRHGGQTVRDAGLHLDLRWPFGGPNARALAGLSAFDRSMSGIWLATARV